jgi:hypothetical protein
LLIIVLFFNEADMLIFDLGVALMYCFTAVLVLGFGIPPPTILTEAVLIFEPLLAWETIGPFVGGLIVEFLLPLDIIELLLNPLI